MQWGIFRNAARSSRLLIGLALVCMVASVVSSAIAVRLGGEVVDGLLTGGDVRRLSLVMLAFAVLGTLAWSASDELIARIASRVAVRVRAGMVRHTLSLPIGFFTDRSAGEVTDRISTDVDTVASGLVNQVKPIIMGLLGAVVAMAVSLTVDARLTVLFVPAGVVLAWSGTASGKRVAVGSRALQAEWAEAAGTAEEAFGARDDLRQSLGRGLVMRRWSEHANRVWAHTVALGRTRNLLTLSTIGVLRAFQIVVLIAGATLAGRGELSAGSVLAGFALVTLFARRIEEVLISLPKLSELVAATQRVSELLAEPAESATTVDAPGVVDWTVPVTIDFDHVCFAYGDGPAVLDHVSLSVRAGRSLAVVGRTGSGKSTLMKLVNRSVPTGPGQVRLAGVDVCAIPLDELRRHVGVVSQRVELLRASLRDNVTLFDTTIPDDRILAAFGHLGLEGWLGDLTDGLDSTLGGHGLVLSAGEEQLVAFARLLVRNPAVVILDEATARLDPGTEALLQAATDRLLAGRTSIIIAHRLATIAGVDDVAVLDEGRVLEHGSRRELLERANSAFGQLVEAAGGIEVRSVIGKHARRLTGAPDAELVGSVGSVEPVDGDDAAPADRATITGPTVASTTAHILSRHLHDFVPGVAGWVLFFTAPAVAAWVWADMLPRLANGEGVGGSIAVFSAACVVGLAGRIVGERYFSRWWALTNVTLRSNLIASQLHPHDDRAGHHPPSPGDAVSRMWDTNDLVNYADHWVDLGCAAVFVFTATLLSGSWSTVPWLVAPIVFPVAFVYVLRPRSEKVAVEHARIKGVWSGRVAEVCAAATTVKGFGAEADVEVHLDQLTRRRQRAALSQRRYELVVFGSVFWVAESAQAIVLIALAWTAAPTAGQVGAAVAISLAIAMMPLTGIIACMIVQEVPMVRAKLGRLARLLPRRADYDVTRAPADLRLPPAPPAPVPTDRPVRSRLHRLDVNHLSVVFDDGTIAIDDISFSVRRGELVIVTGPIASGKSTLLRVLAGLTLATEGDLSWNGDVVGDPSAFLRPPNCAFVAQAPRLISGTVDENVSLDHDVDVRAALRLAELDVDLARAGGGAAMVGHRGLRLSGGQTQRLATARAAAANGELLVLDDLSSALDVVTERQLWQNLRAAGHTVVATSYKRSAIELADRVIVLRQGHIVGEGDLDGLDHEFGHLFA